ncbi:MAG: universal stress protein [Dehalococcoidia bacterium]|nr:universal stress protein [Dehalococcoidia bacterium]
MYEKLLYPVDGSDLSLVALPHVAEIARASGAIVTVLQAVEIVTEADAITVPERRGEADESIHRIVASLRDQGVTVAAPRVIEGDAGRSIVEAADADAADLVIMATHGRSGVRRLALGSVADYVVGHASCPVLLIRPPQDG